ncbi:MAG: hypothetical protein JWO63_1641 [Frankiales bacterium]|nr:hypothetical protein [Frankiales bacterium]
MSTMTATTDPTTIPGFPALALDYPMSLGSYADYRHAQQVVDDLTDRGFPVENLMIVGTDLRSMERVTGRLTRRKLAAAAGLSGLWMGLFVGIAFALFSTHGQLGFLITTPLLGALFGVIWSQLGFRAATRGGARDFVSITQMTASRYEVLVEHHVAAQAHQLLAAGPHR